MSHEVVRRVMETVGPLAWAAEQTELRGKLADESVKLVRESGVMRLLQPTEFGGHAAHPRVFAESVMTLAGACGSTGWVCGIGGMHPWELALMDRQLKAEVWGSNPDSWIASAYAPQGVATPVDGGYRLTGRWNFASGADHSDWILLGTAICDAEGNRVEPPQFRHMVLPRSDYAIVEDSWDVIGLCGTGSKDIVVDGAFIPAYRTIDAEELMSGEGVAERAGRTEPVYMLPFWAMLPLGITAAVIGTCEGALAVHLYYQRTRVATVGGATKDDPYVLYAISEAAAEIAASRTQLLDGISRLYDQVEAGQPISFAQRSLVRRNQISAARRAVAAVDEIFFRSGGNVVRKTNALQRYWRDAHVGLQHAVHVPGPNYHSAALSLLGIEPQGLLRSHI